jgi:GH15 family glucan-1,4-alpha-glucosidase
LTPPSIFASLLDARRGGRFRIAPNLDAYTTTQMYLPHSACLVTRFMSDIGVGELIDFMPIDNPTVVTTNHKIVRGVRCLRGQLPFRLECEPRFDFARRSHKLSLTRKGALFQANGQEAALHGAGVARRSGDTDICLD